ncbi:uncharacterized protein E0L32_004942 [Thyridium curvatum]|uniref:DUF7924 domain-containing protein n=1 Tax=Thyridium curvatum TaxID=1093900 RepID=A0A507B4T7_9PEZI|nr:uncharacterized protein E0L32_004942 [Thyridium curvatum]TPX14833.1 hypothetical protein E0L32_004942 [Thyridium curvatum]
MTDGVSKSQARLPSLKSSDSPEGEREDVATEQPSGSGELGSEHSRSSTEQPSAKKDPTPDTHTKRRYDASCDVGRSPTKRVRLVRTKPHRPESREEEIRQVDESTQQRQPAPPQLSHVSSLERRADGQGQGSPTTGLRKRQIGSDSDDGEHRSKQSRLTRKNLALFNKMAKRKEEKASASAPADTTVGSSTTKTTSTTTSGFAIQANNNGILNPRTSKPPANYKEIRERCARSRRSASPTESVYEGYVKTVRKAVNEATMVVEVSALLKKNDDEGYTRAFNQAFTGFPKDAGFNNRLPAPQPDFIEGLTREDYKPFPVDEHIDGAVLYKDNTDSITLPHLAGEWKGPGGNMNEAMLQSAYDGAALVYARNQALAYLGKSDPPGHAEIMTFTTDGTNLNLFAHYATTLEDGSHEYHQYPMTSTNLLVSHQGHNDGRRELRNEQDHAWEQSRALRDQLKEHWKKRGRGLQSIAEAYPPPGPGFKVPSSTNVYDDPNNNEGGLDQVEQPRKLTPPTSSNLERPSTHDKKTSPRSSSSKSPPPARDHHHDGGSAQKRKASSQESSRRSDRQKSRGKSYWKQDPDSGRLFHERSDGRITWRDDYDDGY